MVTESHRRSRVDHIRGCSRGARWVPGTLLLAGLVLHAGPTALSALSAVGLATGTLIALPLSPWGSSVASDQ